MSDNIEEDETYIYTQLEIQARIQARETILKQEETRLQEASSGKRRRANYSKCSICLDRIFNKHKKWLPCAHFFHEMCIEQWIGTNLTCPECRIPIFIQDEDQLNAYATFLEKKREDSDLIRRNIPTNDYNISLMFIRDPYLFNISVIDDADAYDKFHSIISTEDPDFTEETYAHLFEDEDSEEIDSEFAYELQIREEEQQEAEARERHELEMRYLPDYFLD